MSLRSTFAFPYAGGARKRAPFRPAPSNVLDTCPVPAIVFFLLLNAPTVKTYVIWIIVHIDVDVVSGSCSSFVR